MHYTYNTRKEYNEIMNKNIAILVIFSFVNLFAMDRDINQDHNSSSVELSEFNEEIRTEEINDRAELQNIE